MFPTQHIPGSWDRQDTGTQAAPWRISALVSVSQQIMSHILANLPPVCTSMASEVNYPNRKSFHYTQKFCSWLESMRLCQKIYAHSMRENTQTPSSRQVYIFLIIMGRLCLTEQIMACLHGSTKCSGKSLQCNYNENLKGCNSFWKAQAGSQTSRHSSSLTVTNTFTLQVGVKHRRVCEGKLGYLRLTPEAPVTRSCSGAAPVSSSRSTAS